MNNVIKVKTKQIWFDMDGTIADLYGVQGWLNQLEAEDSTPYKTAKPMINMSRLARYLNKLQRGGYQINIISWGSKDASPEYLTAIKQAKKEWLKKHLKSVKFDVISIVEYGTPKFKNRNGILFDDEQGNRRNWKGLAFDEKSIFEVLSKLECAPV